MPEPLGLPLPPPPPDTAAVALMQVCGLVRRGSIDYALEVVLRAALARGKKALEPYYTAGGQRLAVRGEGDDEPARVPLLHGLALQLCRQIGRAHV